MAFPYSIMSPTDGQRLRELMQGTKPTISIQDYLFPYQI